MPNRYGRGHGPEALSLLLAVGHRGAASEMIRDCADSRSCRSRQIRKSVGHVEESTAAGNTASDFYGRFTTTSSKADPLTLLMPL